MRIHLLSDLHNEFDLFEPEVRDADVVILAGDINVKTRGVEWAKNTFTCPVLYVPGNHEFYRAPPVSSMISGRPCIKSGSAFGRLCRAGQPAA